jgi:hypothetical protein
MNGLDGVDQELAAKVKIKVVSFKEALVNTFSPLNSEID